MHYDNLYCKLKKLKQFDKITNRPFPSTTLSYTSRTPLITIYKSWPTNSDTIQPNIFSCSGRCRPIPFPKIFQFWGVMTKRLLTGEMRTNPVVRPQGCGPVLMITDTNYCPQNFQACLCTTCPVRKIACLSLKFVSLLSYDAEYGGYRPS